MTLTCYFYTVSHVLRKKIDTLSRAPIKGKGMNANTDLRESTNIYVDIAVENSPGSVLYLQNLREHFKTDSTCSTVMKCARMESPNAVNVQETLNHTGQSALSLL